MRPWLYGVLGAALACAAAAAQIIYSENLPIDHPAVRYADESRDNPVARLDARLQRGEVELAYRDDPLGFLPSVLQNLSIPQDSQALVFSKTSLQAPHISPRTPRAVYFADDVAVAFVRGGAHIELAALDPRQGVVFYTLDAKPAATPPRFVRSLVCLQCHQGPATSGVPGWFISSVFPNASGMPDRAGAIVTDHRTLFEDRWGGWYVTGTHGSERHRGNALAMNPTNPHELETEGTLNLTSLVRKLNTNAYLTPFSDLVALMTFEHQTQMVNLMTRAGWLSRIAEHRAGRPVHSDDVDRAIDELVTYMLFADEAPLRSPIEGVSSFTKTFPQRGVRDRKGRSLRDFDLRQRLFRFPLSYMIYSPAFDAMPDAVREQVYRSVYDILSGRDPREKFAFLTSETRRAIIEILRETKPNLPSYFTP